ncbi:unnamed protein product [Urochloa humidicola]
MVRVMEACSAYLHPVISVSKLMFDCFPIFIGLRQRAAAGPVEEEVGESRKLFVGGIPSSAQEVELLAHFARFGEVWSAVVMRDRETGHGRGFGFVEFEDEAPAAAALAKPRHFICGWMGMDVPCTARR